MEINDLHKIYHGPASYQITILGKLDQSFASYWSTMNLAHSSSKGRSYSILTGEVLDQAELSGILNTITNNRFPIVSVLKLEN